MIKKKKQQHMMQMKWITKNNWLLEKLKMVVSVPGQEKKGEENLPGILDIICL